MAESSNQTASSANSGLSVNLGRRGVVRGFPNACTCGKYSVIRTSNTARNPGRLFHCCPVGSEKDKFHLFKWTDESMVEEIEDMKETIKSLVAERRTCEEVVNAFEREIKEMKETVRVFEKKMEAMKMEIGGCEKEVKSSVRVLKNMLIVGVVAIGCCYWLLA